ncbi:MULTISPECIES: hypothetical protein [Mucilaginibacter]|jgi:hypothetical protein|uniref:Uncharacterized protein n=1 Tax=Mucilaginibacter dorajii TaxID=692994 RepID=A0ABP7QK49_9SPHI|nr:MULTISPECIES: hypothetical protein [Mucilaginibacter]MCS3734179.1 hypothetical protein [Mucilaginibacter dorajii]MDN3580708.1 hypothetical protein [Mucilaginibacter flavus]
MTNSILEITESEYLIKLNRSNFNLSFIRSLLKMVEVANPSEESDYTYSDRQVVHPYQNHSATADYFSAIDEK